MLNHKMSCSFLVLATLSMMPSQALCAGKVHLDLAGEMRQVGDSSIAAMSETGILWSQQDITKWSSLELPSHILVRSIAGGSEAALLLVCEERASFGKDGAKLFLARLRPEDTLDVVDPNVGARCLFFDDQLGCEVKGASILITQDGGRTWTPLANSVYAGGDLTAMAWLSRDEMAFGTEGGHVVLVARTNGAFAEKWKIPVSYPVGQFAPRGDDAIWALSDGMLLLNRRDGELIARSPVPMQKEGFSVTGDLLLVWGYVGLSAWRWDGTSLTPQGEIHCGPVEGAFRRDSRTFAIVGNGRVGIVNGLQIDPIEISVRKVPTTGPSEPGISTGRI